MLSIIAANPAPFILAVIIGFATAWWAWSSPAETDADEEYVDEVVEEPAELEAEAEPKPEPDIVEEAKASEPDPDPDVDAVAVAPVAAAPAAVAAVKARSAPKPIDVSEFDQSTKIPSDRPAIAAAVGPADDLSRIKGIGPKLHELCNSLGIKRFDQIAAWSARDVAMVDEHLGGFKGRVTRDEWVAQAKLLADGKVTEHEAQFGA